MLKDFIFEVVNGLLEVADLEVVVALYLVEDFQSDGVLVDERGDLVLKFAVFLFILFELFF